MSEFEIGDLVFASGLMGQIKSIDDDGTLEIVSPFLGAPDAVVLLCRPSLQNPVELL